jgi:hypothetical protein
MTFKLSKETKARIIGAGLAILVVAVFVLIMLSPATVRFWRAIHGG